MTANYYDFDRIDREMLARADTLLPGWLPGGKFEGREYVAINPTRSDTHPGSFKINRDTGQWSDFATGDKGGGLLSLSAYIHHRGDIKAAAANLAGSYGLQSPTTSTPKHKTKPIDRAPEYQAVLPIPPQKESTRPLAHPRLGKPSALWTYSDAEGRTLFYKCRFDMGTKANGKSWKEFRPLHYAKGSNGRHKWLWSDIADMKRPLYNLDALATRPDADVIITEGEKAADAAFALFLDCVATTSSNGSNAPSKTDWTPLKGRHCIIFPDNDAGGAKYAQAVAKLLDKAGAASVRIIDLKIFGDISPAWDAADAVEQGHTHESILTLRNSGRFFLGPEPAHTPEPPDRELPPLDAYENDAAGAGGDRQKSDSREIPRDTTAPDQGSEYPPLPCKIFTFEDFEIEPPPPPFIIAGLMPQDVCMLNATGGTGKSTFELFRSIHIILGLEFLGMPIERPGPVLYVTAEDGKERIHRRLYLIMRDMQLTPEQRRKVAENFRVVDLCEYPLRLVAADRFGTLARTSLAERIITEYRDFAPVVIYFDPFVRFSPGEEYGNDGGDRTIAAMLTLSRVMSCATAGIHHVSKAVYRDGIIDHHSGRGPSSIGDGARCVYSLLAVEGENKKLPGITAAYQHHIDAGELMALFVPKLTDCKPIRDPFIIRRNGWRFDLLKQPTPESIEAARKQAHQDKVKQNLDKLIAYLKEWNLKHHAKADLEEARADMGLSRDDVREAIRVGLREHSLVERELPESEKTRTRRHGIYLGRDWQ